MFIPKGSFSTDVGVKLDLVQILKAQNCPWRVIYRESRRKRVGELPACLGCFGGPIHGTRTLLDVSRALIRLRMQPFGVSGKFKRLTVCELHRALRVGPNGSDCLTGPYGTCPEQWRSLRA